MKAFEQRKKMVEQKKFGKRLQAEKAIARAQPKSELPWKQLTNTQAKRAE